MVPPLARCAMPCILAAASGRAQAAAPSWQARWNSKKFHVMRLSFCMVLLLVAQSIQPGAEEEDANHVRSVWPPDKRHVAVRFDRQSRACGRSTGCSALGRPPHTNSRNWSCVM